MLMSSGLIYIIRGLGAAAAEGLGFETARIREMQVIIIVCDI